eukprot:TRINITY_DN1820_c0_g2_i1.p1 TRINITY_DN1820_c0_g2~~TRINITY_DN1820_c0_g2_i1.p1  ORF type:complete len:352 (-),score=75.47 TRINITY_DN1820_c0_g2_i1:311-1366(-)
MKMVKSAKITKEEGDKNLLYLLSALSFHTKVKFVNVEETKKKNREKQMKVSVPATTDSRPCVKLEHLLTSGDPNLVYRVMNESGRGGFGRVYKAISKETGKKVAVKVLPNYNDSDKKWNAVEFGILKFCKHPNIVDYFECYEIGEDMWGVMEFLEGGTLDVAVKSYNFGEPHIAYVAREMLKGIVYLHSENIIHRDLKSSNVMMSTKGDIKLIDFGLCVDIGSGRPLSIVGSPYWIPPEMIQRQPYDGKVDIWSLGVCLMELANGKAPHNRNALKAMFSTATYGHPEPLDKPKLWEDQFKDFLKQCVTMDPEKRPSAAQLSQHPFLMKSDEKSSMVKILSGIFVLQTILPF